MRLGPGNEAITLLINFTFAEMKWRTATQVRLGRGVDCAFLQLQLEAIAQTTVHPYISPVHSLRARKTNLPTPHHPTRPQQPGSPPARVGGTARYVYHNVPVIYESASHVHAWAQPPDSRSASKTVGIALGTGLGGAALLAAGLIGWGTVQRRRRREAERDAAEAKSAAEAAISKARSGSSEGSAFRTGSRGGGSGGGGLLAGSGSTGDTGTGATGVTASVLGPRSLGTEGALLLFCRAF